jgi:hypothetical protein
MDGSVNGGDRQWRSPSMAVSVDGGQRRTISHSIDLSFDQ